MFWYFLLEFLIALVIAAVVWVFALAVFTSAVLVLVVGLVLFAWPISVGFVHGFRDERRTPQRKEHTLP